MATVFRTTAILADASGRYRTSITMATRMYGGTWSAAGTAEHCTRQGLPTRAYTVTDEAWEYLELNPAARFGYVEARGDVDSPFDPAPWNTHPSLTPPGYPAGQSHDACRKQAESIGHYQRQRVGERRLPWQTGADLDENFPAAWFQDGAGFYPADEREPVSAPFPVPDGDMNAARRARAWFVGYATRPEFR